MENFFCRDLTERFGYGMALYIASKAAAMQRSIDSINAERKALGHRMLSNASIEEVIAVLRRKGVLPVAS
jgi:hypothetical protein